MALGCFATREPPQLEVSQALPGIPLSVSAEFQAPDRPENLHPDVHRSLDEIDEAAEQAFIDDLRATGLFQTVSARSEAPTSDLIAIRLPYEIDDDSYCGELTVAPSILTAGLIPMRACHRAYRIKFISSTSGESLLFQDDYSADTWFGWIPVLFNVRHNWHWYGPPDDALRHQYLRQGLSNARSELVQLAEPVRP